jgi:hypothetical protein
MAEQYAQIAAAFVARARSDPYLAGFGLLLDYSPGSVALLDAFITETFGPKGDSPDREDYRISDGKLAMVNEFGAYLGEVIRPIVGGRWHLEPGQPPGFASVAYGTGGAYPFGKVFSRFKNGAGDALFPLVLSVIDAGSPAARAAIRISIEAHVKHFRENSKLPPERVEAIAASVLAGGGGSSGEAAPAGDGLPDGAVGFLLRNFDKIVPAILLVMVWYALGAPGASFGPKQNAKTLAGAVWMVGHFLMAAAGFYAPREIHFKVALGMANLMIPPVWLLFAISYWEYAKIPMGFIAVSLVLSVLT